uniref:Response regulator receiver modulated PilZ sensor protein n=1 Tax=Geobacter sp. (strain M21) TaxID=443144 RepID=C6E0V6_GEOSM
MAYPKIMLVDDTRLILELEKSFLKLSHVDVVTAGNGAEALELIRKDPPDLIFMDMHMPVMDGIACCAELKADPFLCGIPVVMLTTAGKEEDRERAKAAGCDNFLTKPVDRRLFLDLARKYTNAVERREQRLPCRLPALFLLGRTPAGGLVLDIGDGGVFVATRERLLLHQRLRLALYLEGERPVLLELKGWVAWLNEEGKRVHNSLPAGFGMEFLELGEEESAALKSYLASLRPEEPSAS